MDIYIYYQIEKQGQGGKSDGSIYNRSQLTM